MTTKTAPPKTAAASSSNKDLSVEIGFPSYRTFGGWGEGFRDDVVAAA
jgi:hypothetical protein